MFRSVNSLTGYRLSALDGELGKVRDLLFDDRDWTVRWIAVDTGSWLRERLVVISPRSTGPPDWAGREMPVNLTREQIENSPSIDQNRPVSRQHEIELVRYYGWVPYWGPVGLAAPSAFEPNLQPTKAGVTAAFEPGEGDLPPGDPDLRSVREVVGYHIHARDHVIGHCEDLLVQTDSWTLRYLVVDTRNWLPGRRVLVSPTWVQRVDWSTRELLVDLQASQIREAPAHDPDKPLDRSQEQRLYDHYGRPKYWE